MFDTFLQNSYLVLDEYMCFLNNVNGRKEPSKSILDVGVEAALKPTFFDSNMFMKRDGNYAKTVSRQKRSTIYRNKDFEW